ncbi:MAG: helix-hairpin-helix domain-containing protein [Bryobacterales bacterium]|nr:helix-hairpin-helix domain-containing protein [Bryobacterales bacterium]
MKLSGFLLGLAALAAFGQTLPDGPGKETFQTVCSMCHAPTAVLGKQGTKEWWQAKVTEMLQEVTGIPDSDVDTIVAYLAKNFPVVKINVNKASMMDLETGLELTVKESEAIVHYRDAKGSYKTLDDLKKVPGLDAVKIESKKDRLEF